jgi:hypothetical protein
MTVGTNEVVSDSQTHFLLELFDTCSLNFASGQMSPADACNYPWPPSTLLNQRDA